MARLLRSGERRGSATLFRLLPQGGEQRLEAHARVRYSLLDLEGGDRVGQPAREFPPEGVTDTKFYLDGRSRTLTPDAPAHESPVAYDATSELARVSFVLDFDEETVLVGYPKAKLWVEAGDADDMDLFVLVQKLDAYGSHLQQSTVPNRGALMHDLTERSASVFRYKAPTAGCECPPAISTKR